MADVVEHVPAVPPRGRPRSSEVDRSIVEATMELLLGVGYEGVTMAGVAHRAGVSTATLYRRYQSKEDLVCGVITTLKAEFALEHATGSLAGDIRAMADEGCAAFASEAGQTLRS